MNRFAKPIYTLGVLAMLSLACIFFLPTKIEGGFAEWADFFGAFHPLFLHLPIGTVMLAVSMEVGKIVSRGRWKPQTLWPVFFAAASSFAAAVFGYFSYATNSGVTKTLEDHLTFGTIFAIAIVAVFLMKFAADLSRQKMLEKAYVGLLFVATALMTVASHFGGNYTHGDPLDKFPLTKKDKPKKGKTAAQAQDAAAKLSTESSLYADIVEPIFAEKCYSCHGEESKKGGLRMHKWALMEDRLDFDTPEAGDIHASIVAEMEDEDHMPPKDEVQLTANELKIVKFWMNNGHSKDKTLASLNFPADLLAQHKIEQGAPKVVKKKKKIDYAAIKAEQVTFSSEIDKLNKVVPNMIKFQSRSSTDMILNNVNKRAKFTAEDFALAKKVAGNVIEVNLDASDIGDEVAPMLTAYSKLRKIILKDTKVTDEVCEALAKLETLESINLYGTAITDKGLQKLASLPNLKKVYVSYSKVTKAAAYTLMKNRPEVTVVGP